MSERERALLMGPPGSGKSYQLVKVYLYLMRRNIPTFVVDLEDKLGAMLASAGATTPQNLYSVIEWDEIKGAVADIETKVKPGNWILFDRMDLTWPRVRNWYSLAKYEKELAEIKVEKAKKMTKAAMFTPVFTQGDWEPINEQYDSFALKLLYKFRCHVLMTCGIRGVDEGSPQDIFGHLGVVPRGQKELGHQPHSVFLLSQKKSGGNITWHITTAKDDMPSPNGGGREYFDNEQLFDFSLQYFQAMAGWD